MISDNPTKIREYIVTVKKSVDWQEVHNELIRNTSSDDSVDSNIVPDRECECVNERVINNRNTHYNLSEAEAEKLRNDPRIKSVEALEFIPAFKIRAEQNADFNRHHYYGSSDDSNWGLLRHTKQSDPYTNENNPGLTYDYVLDGTGVDIVIIDSGIEANHPEWQDANGVSRLKEVDWYSISGLSGTMPSNFYTDNHGHGTHCTGLAAGKKFGFAKNADIYCMTLDDLTEGSTNGFTWSNSIDILLAWHQKKNNPSDPGYTGRPTVVNMSFGNMQFVHTGRPSSNDTMLVSTNIGNLPLSGGRYRGTTHTETNYHGVRQYGFIGSYYANIQRAYFGYKVSSEDADVEALTEAGIHVCIAAGNDYSKHDLPGGDDYNNYLTIDVYGTPYYWYYHRGGSPSLNEPGDSHWGNTLDDIDVSQKDQNPGFMVGALSRIKNTLLPSQNIKTNFSDTGPGVNIYAAGDYVNSALSTTNENDPSDAPERSYSGYGSFKEAKWYGTSMASPNMAGLCALLLQVHPDWTPSQVRKYFESNAVTDQLVRTGSYPNNNDEYGDHTSILGGEPRIAYLPMNGKKPFGYSSS